jgi:hypothetical protein
MVADFGCLSPDGQGSAARSPTTAFLLFRSVHLFDVELSRNFWLSRRIFWCASLHVLVRNMHVPSPCRASISPCFVDRTIPMRLKKTACFHSGWPITGRPGAITYPLSNHLHLCQRTEYTAVQLIVCRHPRTVDQPQYVELRTPLDTQKEGMTIDKVRGYVVHHYTVLFCLALLVCPAAFLFLFNGSTISAPSPKISRSFAPSAPDQSTRRTRHSRNPSFLRSQPISCSTVKCHGIIRDQRQLKTIICEDARNK